MEQLKHLKQIKRLMAVGIFLLLTICSRAQLCTNSADTVYGLDLTGGLVPINIHTATVGASLGTASLSENSNGLGYSNLNGKFYFFSRSAAAAAPFQQFVSYNPAAPPASAKQILTGTLPATLTNTQKIRSGTVNNLGTGYYTINPNGVRALLYFYNITLNTWTTVTNTWIDNLANDISTGDMKNLNSGDMAFDGLGNLWILASSTTQYALYKINAPVPTTAVASVTVQIIISKRNNPTMPGVSFTGLGFNSAGDLFMATGGTTGIPTAANNNLFRLVSPTAPLDSIGKLPNDRGGDITPCTYPASVLPTIWKDFTAKSQGGIELTWTAYEDASINGYNVEYSSDGEHWKTLEFVNRSLVISNGSSTYHYTDHQYSSNNNFYRIIQVSASGKKSVSVARLVITKPGTKIFVGPNPAKEVLYVYNKSTTARYRAKIFDRTGSLVYVATLYPDTQNVDISTLPKGTYTLTLISALDNSLTSHRFIKW
jgi:Secretion system C-terminal sorting domain